MTRILAADIGGTNSRFASFSLHGGVLELQDKTWLATAEAESFGRLLEMLGRSGFSLPPTEADLVVLAVAGAVEDGLRCDPVNIHWSLDLRQARRDYGLRDVWMINDFEAQAFATRTRAVEHAKCVLPGAPRPGGTVAVIGAGTGLGKCALASLERGGFRAVPSEGGHSLFAFMNGEEYAFARFVRRETCREQVIGDMIVSGPGLRLVHKYLTGQWLEPREIGGLMQQGQAPGTLAWFSRFYGRACRNYALEVLATGGMFIAGGVASKTPEILDHPNFAHEFRWSETHAPLLADIPVMLNDNQDSGLWGAAAVALQRENSTT